MADAKHAGTILIVAGVAGAGKSTVGRLLADRLDCAFLEGDDLHPAANVAKLRSERPLDDADRAPWLAAIARWITARATAREAGIATCSALRRTYRERLRIAGGGSARFVLLDPDRTVLAMRLAARRGHFMPAALLTSQLAALERPVCEPDMLRLTDALAPEALSNIILAWRARSLPA